LPLYPYRCTACGHTFEKIQSFSAAPETECPQCQGKLERTLTAPALSFKGAGWYVNDYAGNAAAPKAETPCGGGSSPSCASCPAAAANN
jgi:putative FmdB family regulatory protein